MIKTKGQFCINMIKRTVSILLIAAIASLAAILFAACANCGTGSTNGGEATRMDTVKEISDFIKTRASFAELESVNETDLSDVFGVEADKLKCFEMLLSVDKTLADEIAVFELSDASYKSELMSLLKARLSSAANMARDYSPKQYDIIIKSTVEEMGNFVFYVVNEKSESIISELKRIMEG